MGKLEEIARAICEASGKSWRTGTFTALTGTDTINNRMTWEEHDLDPYNNHWRHIALAAVKAMREPTEAMVEAAWVGTKNVPPEARMAGELFMSARDLHNEKMKLRYGAMIGAIIAEAEQEGE